MKRTFIIPAALYFLPTIACAHGFALYVSTPITPPREFIWWFPFAVGILIIGTFVIMRRFLSRRRPVAIGLSVLAFILFAVSFLMFGLFAASVTTAPPPGLGVPCSTFWGMGWSRVGWLFIRWNIYGYLFLLGSLFLCGGTSRTKPRFKQLMKWTAAFYVAGIIPYVVTGAWVHGWAGGYIHMGCERRLEILNTALLEYVDNHHGQLPAADGMESLLKELKPYLADERIRYLDPINVCPLGNAYERNPKAYEWNSLYSGVRLADIDLDKFYKNIIPISCPYHPNFGRLATFKLSDRIIRAADENPQLKP